MGYEINLGNGEWATGQGGMALTVTDTDTGIKDALLMGCERNALKTEVDKDNVLVDVLSYQPSVTYVNGVGYSSQETQAEQLLPNSGWLGGAFPATGWASSGASALPYQSNKYSSVFKYNFINRSYMSYPISVVSGNKYTFSCFVEDVVITDQIANVIRTMHSGIKTYYKNGVEVVLTDNVEAGNFYSIVLESDTTESQSFRCGLGVTNSGTTSNVSVCMPQVEEGSKRTSFMLSPVGATYTRLQDDGFKTPDISKWVNSSSLYFQALVTPSLIDNATGGHEITLNNGSTSDRVRVFFDSTPRMIIAVVAGGVEAISYTFGISNVMDEINIEAEINGADITLKVNESTVGSISDFTGFQDDLKFLSFDRGDGVSIFNQGNIKGVKIIS